MWDTAPVSTDVQERPYSRGERVILLITRMLTATFLTALVGAIENWFYERFFAPDLYAAGHPLARGVFMLVFSFPYVLVGFVLLGLPAAYALERMRAGNAFAYALAGAVTGALWGVVAVGVLTTYGVAVSAFYGCLCALFWWRLRPRS